MKPKTILIIAGLIPIVGICIFFWYVAPKIQLPKLTVKNVIEAPRYYSITRVIDGDTIEVNMDGRIEKVRLIGLDTPETKKPNSSVECFGQAASAFAQKIMDNQKIRLEVDPINPNRDRYNRLLRYVYIPDGKMINSEMIAQGFGFAYLSFPFTKIDEFKLLEEQAREAQRGLWASGTCSIRNENGRFKTNPL